MKKSMIVAGCMAMTFAMSSMAFGIELSAQGAKSLMNPASGVYVTGEKGEKILYTSASTAYRPSEMNTILKAYGLTLDESKVSSLPRGYATSSNGKIAFSDAATAYSPEDYHAIFTSYGLVLDAACIQSTMPKFVYATKVASDGKVTLGDKATAYTGEQYAEILKCYNLPMKAAVAKPVAQQHTGWVIASDYLFDFNKAVIKKQYYSKLDEVAASIKKDPTMRVEVQGYTDSIGSVKYNLGLSKRRANAVRDYLIKKGGIAADRLTAVGYGKSKPVASNDTPEGRAKNRRVELQPIK